ncbi:MAG: DUF4012 domain-containing protein [Mycobacterium sp.]|nr:DUF4012 domain-containing protein [Mycobacterium sp.]
MTHSSVGDDQQPWFKRRGVVRAALVALAVVLLFGGWLGFKALAAKNGLEQARESAQESKDALLGGKTEDASRFAAEAQSHAQSARDATHSLPWNIAAAVPLVGSPFKTGQQISDVVLDLAADVLKPTADAGMDVAPNRLFSNGQLDVKALRKDEPTLSTIADNAARINTDAQAITDPHFPVLSGARSQLQEQTSDLAKLMKNTALAAKVAPSLMGADGPRSYFMGFQTNAEARGTGGLLGGFGVLRFVDGKPSIEKLGPNTTLMDGPFTPFPVDPEFDAQYGFTNPTTDIRNSNQSSHFPFAGEIWKGMWAQKSGMNVDGAIAIDPIALSYILGATGPVVMPDGETVSENNVVELTESTLYQRFPTDQVARKQYLQDIATEVVKKLTKPVESPRKLLDALGRAVSERRIAVWSANPADQKLLEETPLAHVIPDDPAPYAGVVINNLGGNKMDYYLKREIEYVADGCKGDTRQSTVTVKLTNTVVDVDANALTDYAGGRLGFHPEIEADIPKGTMLTSVRLLATKDAKLASVLVDGTRTPVFQTTERNHPSFEAQVAIPPGKTVELVFQLSEPTSAGEPRVPVQPLKDEVNPKVSVPACS